MNENENLFCEVQEIHRERLKAVAEKLPPEEHLLDLAELFKIFGDTTRIRILFVLFEEGVDAAAVMKAVRKACKKVEDDCEIFL